MKMFAVVIALLLGMVTCLPASSPASAQPADDHLIVPGERIGPIVLGAQIADVVKILGTPAWQRTVKSSIALPIPDGAVLYVWVGFGVGVDKTGIVYEVEAFDAHYQTAESLHIGSRAGDITAAFGNPSRLLTATAKHAKAYVYNQRGILFLVQTDRRASNYDRVGGISVFASGADQKTS